MNIDTVVAAYREQWERHYPQVPMTARIRKDRNGMLVVRTTIRGDVVQPDLTMDELITATATFMQRGRPTDKLGRYVG